MEGPGESAAVGRLVCSDSEAEETIETEKAWTEAAQMGLGHDDCGG